MVQWWEHLPPTNVTWVRFPDPVSYVGWVCCWFSTLLREVFLQVLGFSPLLKNQHFQIPIPSGMHGHFWTSSCELLGAPWLTNYIYINFFYVLMLVSCRFWCCCYCLSYLSTLVCSFFWYTVYTHIIWLFVLSTIVMFNTI